MLLTHWPSNKCGVFPNISALIGVDRGYAPALSWGNHRVPERDYFCRLAGEPGGGRGGESPI